MATLDRMNALFCSLDRDGNRVINANDFAGALQSPDPVVTWYDSESDSVQVAQAKVRALMAELSRSFDFNADGQITEAEFLG